MPFLNLIQTSRAGKGGHFIPAYLFQYKTLFIPEGFLLVKQSSCQEARAQRRICFLVRQLF